MASSSNTVTITMISQGVYVLSGIGTFIGFAGINTYRPNVFSINVIEKNTLATQDVIDWKYYYKTQFQFSKINNDLVVVNKYGTNSKTTIKDWFLGTQYQTSFRFREGLFSNMVITSLVIGNTPTNPLPTVVTIRGTEYGQTLTAGSEETYIYGSELGNNTIIGGTNKCYLYAYGSNNTIKGGSGNTYIDGGNGGGNRIYGGNGNDIIEYYLNDILVTGGSGTNTLTASKLTTGLSYWKLSSFQGFQYFIGTNYNDIIEYSKVASLIDGGSGTNTLDASKGTVAVTIDYTSPICNFKNFSKFIGTNYNDYIKWNDTNCEITTGNGTNTVILGNGVNIFNSGNGKNTVTGGNGTNTFNMGTGNNVLYGGTGNNIYGFPRNFGTNLIITKNNSLSETLKFKEGISKNTLIPSMAENDCILKMENGSITIKNWTLHKIDNIQFYDGTIYTVTQLLQDAADDETGGTPGSDPTIPIRNNYAVLIGINTYPLAYAALKSPVNDVAEVKFFLLNNPNWNKPNITTITNASATRMAVLNACNNLATKVVAGDQVIFFFSGHGYWGGSMVAADWGAITPQDIYNNLKNVANTIGDNGHIIVVVDACFSGAFSDYFRNITAGPKWTILASSGVTQASYDLGFNSAYTYYAINKGLNQKTSDLDSDNKVMTYELNNYLLNGSYKTYAAAQMYEGKDGGYQLG